LPAEDASMQLTENSRKGIAEYNRVPHRGRRARTPRGHWASLHGYDGMEWGTLPRGMGDVATLCTLCLPPRQALLRPCGCAAALHADPAVGPLRHGWGREARPPRHRRPPVMGDVALSVISLSETTPPGGGGGLVRRGRPSPAGPAFPPQTPRPLSLARTPRACHTAPTGPRRQRLYT
jgi:hypothetical protein